jgi:hypothetical protein
VRQSAADSAALPPHRSWRADRHYRIVLCAEVRRLVRELEVMGPLPREMLARQCHASHWRQGSFEAAVRAGIRHGTLRRMPFDFIDVVRPGPASSKMPDAEIAQRESGPHPP